VIDEPGAVVAAIFDHYDGRMYMIKVTPSHGVPYYLVDTQGDGNFARLESLDDRVRVPMWIIKTF
jgi:hypothetical protein